MNDIIIFYHDKYNRKVEFKCSKKEFKTFAIELLEEHLDKGTELYYTINMNTEKLDYYNI
jgi:hypothetical protein